MKRLFTIMFFALFGIAAASANADAYRLNESTVNDMFASAEVVDFLTPNAMAPLVDFGSTSTAYFSSDKTPAVAFILAWFIGYLGIHRMYMGTSTGTIIAYIITGGGCGVVWLIDWIVLLIGVVDDDISKYIDNPKFFMW
jgi:TM2 domain-containing membrane protein YozV